MNNNNENQPQNNSGNPDNQNYPINPGNQSDPSNQNNLINPVNQNDPSNQNYPINPGNQNDPNSPNYPPQNQNGKYNYGKTRQDNGVGCSPTVASGCVIAIIILAVIIFGFTAAGSWIFKWVL